MNGRSLSFPRLVLGANALIFLGFGVVLLVIPAQILALADISLASADATTEIRALYGGMELGVGGFLAYLFRSGQLRLGLGLSAATLGSMAGARLVGIVLAGPVGPVIWALGAAELVGFLLSLAALRYLPA